MVLYSAFLEQGGFAMAQEQQQPQPPTDKATDARSGPNVVVLSSAGKPIFSRWGDEEKLTAACGLIQAIRAGILDDPSLGGTSNRSKRVEPKWCS